MDVAAGKLLQLRAICDSRWYYKLIVTIGIIAIAYMVRQAIPIPINLAPYAVYAIALIPITILCGFWYGVLGLLMGLAITFSFYISPATEFGKAYGYVRASMFIVNGITNIAALSLMMQALASQSAKRQKVTVLLREVSHRVKNQFAIVSAIARQSLCEGKTAKEYQDEFVDRINGLALSHDLLVNSDWGGVEISKLVNIQMAPFKYFSADGPELKLKAEAVQYLGMALHEMATNSTKYGALSKKGKGKIRIKWMIKDDQLYFRWNENGPIINNHETIKYGFGRTVVERLTALALEGKSELKFLPNGIKWMFSCPLNAIRENNMLAAMNSGSVEASPS